MSTETVKIASLGAKGDGVAHTAEGPVFVPYALPGETVAIARVKNQGTIMSITTASPTGWCRPAGILGRMVSAAPAAAAFCNTRQKPPTMPSSGRSSSTR